MKPREIAEKMIKDGKAMISEAEAKLVELDKPESRHGSKVFYRSSCSKSPRIVLFDSMGVLSTFDENGVKCQNMTSSYIALDEPTIFDDLKRNSEDLTEFEIKSLNGLCNIVEMAIDNDGDIKTIWDCDYLEQEQAVDFHQKLGQLISTARRRKEK